MAIQNLSDVGVSNVLREIIVGGKKSDKEDSIFLKYREKKEIGEKIFNDLLTTFETDSTKDIGFRMTDSSSDVGILSQCQSLQALLLLTSEYDLEFDTDYSRNKDGMTIREIMDIVIEDLLEKRIGVDKTTGEFIFDASPYETKLFDAKYSNIDAIRWVVPTFLLVLQYHAKIGEICKWEDRLIEVIKYGLQYINDAFIGDLSTLETVQESYLKYGWNFTKDCEEPSLYYTFAVCECYLSVYRTFEDHLSYREAIRTEQDSEGLISIPAEMRKKRETMKTEHDKRSAMPDPGYEEKNGIKRRLARYDTDNELVRLYKRINNDVETIRGSLYGELEKRCKAVAGEIWRLAKNDFADSFFYNDLANTISQEDIRMSTTSDALFNSVYIINAIIDAGLDEDIRLKQQIAAAKSQKIAADDDDTVDDPYAKEAERYQREYNELLETCQLASQRALRSYETLKKEGKEYIVDQFLVGFNENFTVHRDRIRELRKLRMRVFSLLPMLIRTNNLISEYLVRYPQATMSKYLGYILENRRVETETRRSRRRARPQWIWETDGFFSASNYYYVAALGQFYSYYEEYEKNYIAISEKNNATVDLIRAEYLKELKEDGEIAQLNKRLKDEKTEASQELKAAKERIAALEAEIAAQHNPIEDAVKAVVTETIEKQLPALFTAFVELASKNLAAYNYDRNIKHMSRDALSANEAYQQALALKNAFDDFFVATVSGTIYSEIKNKEAYEAEYQAARKNIIAENGRCLGEYTTEIMSDTDLHRSELFKNS